MYYRGASLVTTVFIWLYPQIKHINMNRQYIGNRLPMIMKSFFHPT